MPTTRSSTREAIASEYGGGAAGIDPSGVATTSTVSPYTPSSPTYHPVSPTYTPPSPDYRPKSPTTQPPPQPPPQAYGEYRPKSPTTQPPPQAYGEYRPTSPSYPYEAAYRPVTAPQYPQFQPPSRPQGNYTAARHPPPPPPPMNNRPQRRRRQGPPLGLVCELLTWIPENIWHSRGLSPPRPRRASNGPRWEQW